MNQSMSDALVDLHTVSGVFGHIEPPGAVDPHRDGAPEAFFGLQARRTLALGGHIRARLQELSGPLREGGIAEQGRSVDRVRAEVAQDRRDGPETKTC